MQAAKISLAGGTHVNCSTILGSSTLVRKGDLMPGCKQLGINVGGLIFIWALLPRLSVPLHFVSVLHWRLQRYRHIALAPLYSLALG